MENNDGTVMNTIVVNKVDDMKEISNQVLNINHFALYKHINYDKLNLTLIMEI